MVAADSPIAAAVLIADWTAGAVGPVAWSAQSRWQWAGSRSPQGRFHILEHARHLTSMRAPWPRLRSSRKAWFRISCSYPLVPPFAFRRLGNPRPICWCNPSTRPMAWCKGGGSSARPGGFDTLSDTDTLLPWSKLNAVNTDFIPMNVGAFALARRASGWGQAVSCPFVLPPGRPILHRRKTQDRFPKTRSRRSRSKI